jgi:hypothetical protein
MNLMRAKNRRKENELKNIIDSVIAFVEGSPVINVGFKGGDLQTRVFTATVTLILIVLVAPPTGVSDGAIRIATLASAIAGTVFLMTGLVFTARTHYAGLVLTALPLIVKLLVGWQARWIAVVIGIAALGGSILNLTTRRCGLNKLLRISSV